MWIFFKNSVKFVLVMTLNSIRENVEYSFVVITPSSTLTQNGPIY